MRIVRGSQRAKSTVLKRIPLEQYQPPPALKEKIKETFGRELSLEETVRQILDEVKDKGDDALLRFTRLFDGVEVKRLEVTRREIKAARRKVDRELLQALKLAAKRIRSYHQSQKRHGFSDFFQGGVGQFVQPLERVGLYAPGGKARYPSTVLMTAIPARVAGVKEIILTTPPSVEGRVPPSLLVAAEIAEVDRVFQIGGAQAIAALAFGTRSIPRVDKICGPGNIFVTLAKRMVFGSVAIDGLQGPTETVVVADETASPLFCAIDILAQAEHDALATAIFITTSWKLAQKVNREVKRLLEEAERKDIAAQSLEARGGIIIVENMEEAISLVNLYAPEHVSLVARDAFAYARKIKNAGGVFLGEDSPETLGDYVAGPSHVMPTGGTARFSSALGVGDFLKITSLVAVDKETLKKIGPAGATIARAEGLDAHAKTIELRLFH